MATSIMIHEVSGIRSTSVAHNNGNAVSIMIDTAQGCFDITLFGLATEDADHLSAVLSPSAVRKSEDEIRADERKRIAERIGISA